MSGAAESMHGFPGALTSFVGQAQAVAAGQLDRHTMTHKAGT